MMFIDIYIYKLHDKLIMYLVDIAFTIPCWYFIAQFVLTGSWYAVIMFLLLGIGCFICVYNSHKNHNKSLTKIIN